MKSGGFIELGIIILMLYVSVFREYVLNRRRFKCLRCGNCCKLLVKPSKEEIEKIKKAGYKDFLDKKGYLKKVNGSCLFLKINKGLNYCSIQNIKPKICNDFPIKKGIFGKKADMRCKVYYGKFA